MLAQQNRLKSVLFGLQEVIYFLLLLWPAYVAISYMLISGSIKIIGMFIMFAIEITQGVFIALRILKRIKETNKISSKIHFGIISGSWLIYTISVVIYTVAVTSSVITGAYVKNM